MPSYCIITWDVDRARALYDQGLTYYAMAQDLLVNGTTLRRYAYLHWPPRKRDWHLVTPKRTGRPRPGEPSLPPLASLGSSG